MQKALIAFLLALVVWMGAALVRIENERYALILGLCHSPLEAGLNSTKEFDSLRTTDCPSMVRRAGGDRGRV